MLFWFPLTSIVWTKTQNIIIQVWNDMKVSKWLLFYLFNGNKNDTLLEKILQRYFWLLLSTYTLMESLSNFLKVKRILSLKHARVLTHATNGSSTSRNESVCASHKRHHAPSPASDSPVEKSSHTRLEAFSCLLGIVASFPILTH